MPSASRRLELGRSKDPPSKTAHPICMEDTRILICFVRFAIIHLNKLTSLSLRDFPPLKPFERRGYSADVRGGYSKSDPVDVALVSPQTPLIPPFHPLLAGVCRRRHPWIPFYSQTCSGFFASSLATYASTNSPP